MKNKLLILTLILTTLFSNAQDYSFPIFFEDAAGNKDTLVFGFGPTATFDIDENLGEVNILGQPYDSTLFVFFTDAVSKEDYGCDLQTVKNPSYFSKTQFIDPDNNFFIEAGMIADKMPVKISWDSTNVKLFEQNYPIPDMHIIMTGWHPPGGWFDAICCSGNWPDVYIPLSGNSHIELGEKDFCLYTLSNVKDSVNLFYIGLSWFSGNKTVSEQKTINVHYDQYTRTVKIFNASNHYALKVEIFNIWGELFFKENIITQDMPSTTFNINPLPNGIYILRVNGSNNNYPNNNLKIIIK